MLNDTVRVYLTMIKRLQSVGVCCCEEVSVFVPHSVCFARETKMERGYAFANSDIFRGAQERTSLFVLFDW